MTFRIPASIGTSLLFLTSLSAVAQQKAHKVVFALTSAEAADWNLTTGNIRNLLAVLPAGSLTVEVVAYGPGLGFVLAHGSSESAIEELEKQHVAFVACENSMRMQHVSKEGLVPGVTTVPSGVAEVIAREEDGWSYVKAGR